MPDIKKIRSLQQKKFRDELGLFVVEGIKSVSALLESKIEVVEVYYTKKNSTSLWGELSSLVDEKSMQRMSSLKQAPGVLAVAKTRDENSWPDIPIKNAPLVVLDDISDPGNLGTIIRLADWFNASLGLTTNCVETYNPKVVQATMASLFNRSIHRKPRAEWISFFEENDLEVAIADMEGENVMLSEAFPDVIIIGNEAHGVSQGFKTIANSSLNIPRFGAAESLNAAMATGIILYESKRRSIV